MGKHALRGKSEWPVLEQIRTPFCSQKSNCHPNANLQPKRQFPAERQFAAQTPICIAAKKHFSCPNACIPEVLLRKDHRACCQGSMRCAPLKSPQSPQGRLSGKHAMRVPEKSEGPVRWDSTGWRRHKLRRACCQGSIRCVAPESPNGLFSNKFERNFAARTSITPQTHICSPNANSLPNASLQPKRQFAYLMHFCSRNAFQLPKRMYTREACDVRL